MRVVGALAALTVLGACLGGAPERDPATPITSFGFPQDRVSCAASGGRWGQTGQGGHTCYAPLGDAGRACTAAGDCEGACSARSRSCAPVRPLMGCHEILTEGGTVATQCIGS